MFVAIIRHNSMNNTNLMCFWGLV